MQKLEYGVATVVLKVVNVGGCRLCQMLATIDRATWLSAGAMDNEEAHCVNVWQALNRPWISLRRTGVSSAILLRYFVNHQCSLQCLLYWSAALLRPSIF